MPGKVEVNWKLTGSKLKVSGPYLDGVKWVKFARQQAVEARLPSWVRIIEINVNN